MQKIIDAENAYGELSICLKRKQIKRLMIVCDDALKFLSIKEYLDSLSDDIELTYFSKFHPNPSYESVVEGVRLFLAKSCDAIFAIGGGSAIDVAKCIKLYCKMDLQENFLKQKIVRNDIILLAMPTTAGTGSEATKYAVIYYKKEKQSISDESCIPSYVVFDAGALSTLPMYQKKSTMLDAFCHALESFWSINSTDESKEYSYKAIECILSNWYGYLDNEEQANRNMLYAANLAGKAINITQTTAGHAMCYKLTSLFGIAHGHAAALCNAKLLTFMVNNLNKSIDVRGQDYLSDIFKQISTAMGCENINAAIRKYNNLLEELSLAIPKASNDEYIVLKESVNPVRLKNHPIRLDEDIIDNLYHQILSN